MPEPLTVVRSRSLVLPDHNLDTDQIIPARFLTTTAREGLGAYLFADRRDQAPWTDPRAAECSILVAGANFGCGSSREHAPWALHDFGFRVVISSEIADIFRNNALKNGLLPVVLEPAAHAALLAAPWQEIEVDLPARRVRAAGQEYPFEVDPFGAWCLERGLDAFDYLLQQEPAITAFEAARA